MNDQELLDLMRQALREGGARPAATPDCLDDDTLAALAEGSLDPKARAEVLPHLAACRRCRAVVASVAAALADPDVARDVRALERPRPSRYLRFGIPAAAVAAVALFILFRPASVDRPGGEHRAPTITGAPAPAAVSPVGEVASARLLRWAAVDGADRYRATVFDAEGLTLYEIELADTVAPLPDSLGLAPGRTYLWKVAARTDFDRWVSSELVEFSIAGPPR